MRRDGSSNESVVSWRPCCKPLTKSFTGLPVPPALPVSVSMLWLFRFIVVYVVGASEINLLVSLEVIIVHDVINPRDIP
jgi:hypothetical protein